MALLRKEDVERTEVPAALEALLGPASRFEGKLTFQGTVRIDGAFVGEIVSDGTLVIGEGAEVEGTLQVANAVIAGRVNGTLRVRETLELKAAGRLTGEISAGTLVTERGAFLDGTVKMEAPTDDGRAS
ncbi:MAG: polymer-forming cytoskeletal protein [bacterium]